MDSLDYLMQHVDFKECDEPERARNIIKKYFSGTVNVTEECLEVINGIVSSNRKCADLDLRLDSIFSHSNLPYPRQPSVGVSSGPIDDDSGYWNVARRQQEESTNHNPLLVS